MKFIGIDPGVTGAIAVIESNGVSVIDMPTTRPPRGKKRVIDPAGLYMVLHDFLDAKEETFAVLEKVNPMMSFNGNSSVGGIAMANAVIQRISGLCEGMLIAMGIPYQLASPQTWKKSILIDATKDKGASITVAKRLYPSSPLTAKSHHNRAEAILLAEYGRRLYSGAHA